MSQFDSLIIGEVAQDTNVDYDGTTVHAVGGAVYYSGLRRRQHRPQDRGAPQGGHGPRWTWPPPSPQPQM